MINKVLNDQSTEKSRQMFYKLITNEEFDLALMLSTGGSDIM